MTILYKPVLIESEEQAEALPEGTVVIHRKSWPREKDGDEFMPPDSIGPVTPEQVVGWTALVPIEAEEETRTRWDEGDPVNDLTLKSRYVTAWEEA